MSESPIDTTASKETLPQDELAKVIGDKAQLFTQEQASAMNNPAMHAKLREMDAAGHLDHGPFIDKLREIANQKVINELGASTPRSPLVHTPNSPAVATVAETIQPEKIPLRRRLGKYAGKAAMIAGGSAVAFSAAFGGISAVMDSDKEATSFVLANDIETETISSDATEAEKIKFFDIGPSTHDQTLENSDPGDDFNFRPAREELFKYDGSKESIKMLLDDMSDMFRRDVRIQSAWASMLKIPGAPQVPTAEELQVEAIFYQWHRDSFAFTDKMARDIHFRTTVYNQMMDTFDRGKMSDRIHHSDKDRISVQHDGKEVTIAMNIAHSDHEKGYVIFEGESERGEKIQAIINLNCGQWTLLVDGKVVIPETKIIHQPREVYFPPTVAPTPVTEVPRWTQPPVTTAPPPKPQPPRWTPAPKRPVDIPPAPTQVQGWAPPVVEPATLPPPPPAPNYVPPAPNFQIQIPNLGGIFQTSPGARPSLPGGTWDSGQTGSIPRNTVTNPGGGSGQNNNMVGQDD